jgi:hypothetical protein
MWYDFYPTRCVSIPSPRLGDRKHTTRWIKIISHHKPWKILYLRREEQIRNPWFRKTCSHINKINMGSPTVCSLISFISNELCVFNPHALARRYTSYNDLFINHIKLHTIRDSFYHIISLSYDYFSVTLFFGLCWVYFQPMLSIAQLCLLTLCNQIIYWHFLMTSQSAHWVGKATAVYNQNIKYDIHGIKG